MEKQITLKDFFKEFDVIKISSFAKVCNTNDALMRKYAVGIHKPSKRKLDKIQKEFDLFVSELQNVKFIQ